MREPLIPENMAVGCSSVFPAGEIPTSFVAAIQSTMHGLKYRQHIKVTLSQILGLKQNEFSITTDFFRMNPLMRNFDVQLNITRCIDTGRKITCSSGLSTLKIKVTQKLKMYQGLFTRTKFQVNDPPVDGVCKIINLGNSESGDPSNPGLNTALLDIFHIKVLSFKNTHSLALSYRFMLPENTFSARIGETPTSTL